jgi:hypothetical protein
MKNISGIISKILSRNQTEAIKSGNVKAVETLIAQGAVIKPQVIWQKPQVIFLLQQNLVSVRC